jgi:hypothetical protein
MNNKRKKKKKNMGAKLKCMVVSKRSQSEEATQ